MLCAILMALRRNHDYTSQKEYASRMNCIDTAPVIDFTKHFLFDGWVAFANCATLKDQDIKVNK